MENCKVNLNDLMSEPVTESRWQIGFNDGYAWKPKVPQHELVDHPFNRSYLNGYHCGSRTRYFRENPKENPNESI